MHKKARVILSLTFMAVILSSGISCAPSTPAAASSAMSVISAETTTVGSSAAETSVTETIKQTSVSSADTKPAVTSSIKTTAPEKTTVPESSDEITETSETSVSETSDISSSDTAETTTAASSAETTTAVTSASASEVTAPPAAPSPPKISHVSSDGVDVSTCNKGTIDYSNISCGYVSAVYTGNKPLAKIRISYDDKNYDYTITADGVYHYFPLSCGSGSYSVKMFEQADGNYYSDVTGCTFDAKISDDIKLFTYTNDRVQFNENSQCVKKASELCGGCNDDFEKIAEIFKFVANNVSYDYELAATVKSGYIPFPDRTLQSKTGICFDYAALMAAMLRSQGIPTKLIVGYASPEIYHAWNEVYTEKTGWITLEVFIKSKGFNLLDTTFYSTTADKKAIASYMSDKSNYKTLYVY